VILTNPNGLPQALVRALSPDHERKFDPWRIGVTDLIAPPLPRMLRHKHWKDMTERVDDRIWLLFGLAVHYYLETFGGGVSEKKLEIPIDGTPFTLVGVVDLTEEGQYLCMVDWKVTSVMSILLGDKEDWDQQLNVYAWMYQRFFGVRPARLKNVAFLRDWNERESLRDSRYPRSAVYVHDVPFWDNKLTERFIMERLDDHHESLLIGTGRPCTPAERWHKPDSYAVLKAGVRRARRVLPSQEAAEDWAAKNIKGPHSIEFRAGEDSKCLKYCGARNFCPANIYLRDGI